MSEPLMINLLRNMKTETQKTLTDCYEELYQWELNAYMDRIKLIDQLIDNINLTYREDIKG